MKIVKSKISYLFGISLFALFGFVQMVNGAVWQPYPSNPVISYGQAKPFAMWNDPSVIKVGSGYIMYLTANSTDSGSVLPYRATSNDGINWNINTTPVLNQGGQNSFDGKSVETPSVIFFKNQYHMYYTGVSNEGLGAALAIGHAVSSDGINWTRPGNSAILSPTGSPTDWNGYQIGEPGAVIFNNKVYLYFMGVGLLGDGLTSPYFKRSIGLATSDDGFSFGSQAKVM